MLTFVAAAVAIVPQGLGAPWAAQISPTSQHGLAQGMIMAAVPFGSIFGSLMVSRLIRPDLRLRLLGLMAIAAPVPLIFAAVNTPIAVAVLAALAGFAVGGLVPVANGAFVSVLPNEYRARAFGVVSGGLQLVQGFAVLFTGLVAAHAVPIGMAVSFWCTGGLLLMLALVHPWTRSARSLRAVTARTPVPAAVPGTMEP
jgi:MFS family permease